jgi:ribosomal protein S8E
VWVNLIPKATPKATIGKITNCEKNPTKKSLGTLNILTKSFIDKPSPSPSIINARQIGAILVTISIPLYLLITLY